MLSWKCNFKFSVCTCYGLKTVFYSPGETKKRCENRWSEEENETVWKTIWVWAHRLSWDFPSVCEEHPPTQHIHSVIGGSNQHWKEMKSVPVVLNLLICITDGKWLCTFVSPNSRSSGDLQPVSVRLLNLWKDLFQNIRIVEWMHQCKVPKLLWSIYEIKPHLLLENIWNMKTSKCTLPVWTQLLLQCFSVFIV